MSLTFREATEADIPEIVALLRDDVLGAARQPDIPTGYAHAFARIEADPSTALIVGLKGGRIMATYQLDILHGLSRGGATRAQIEAVRVASELRGQGAGGALFEDARKRAVAAGASLLQLTSDMSRQEAHAFYERLGFVGSHIGYKLDLRERE